MEQLGSDTGISILDVLGVDLCARAILDLVPLRQLVRTERICRRWQQILHHYLRSSRYNHILYDVYSFYLKAFREGCPNNYIIFRQVGMYFAHQSLLLAYKALDKFEPLQDNISDEYFNYIQSSCPYLRHLKSLSKNECIGYIKEWRTSELFIHKSKSAFSIYKPYVNLTGDISKLIKSNILTWKTVRYAMYNLRHVTTLDLDDHTKITRDYVNFLLNAMPQLENLSFCNYTSKYTSILYNGPYVVPNDRLIESISRLTHLKRLRMRNNTLVDAELLKALERCKELQYLDISYDSVYNNWPKMYKAGDVAALCCASPLTTITLCFRHIQNNSGLSLEKYVQAFPVVQELETLGFCVEPPQWLVAWWVSEAGIQPLELRMKHASCFKDNQSAETDELNLKIVLNTDLPY